MKNINNEYAEHKYNTTSYKSKVDLADLKVSKKIK